MIEDTFLGRIERVLDELLPNDDSRIAQAMRYSCLNGGKRLRAALVYACANDFAIDKRQVDHAAAAIECIHAYSLIHDDLPAMDDDDLRRGKPSNHIAFDEATAILAGDALNTFAFQTLSQSKQPAEIIVKQIEVLAQAAGAKGMIGGQMLDILHTENTTIAPELLERIHQGKTAALFIAALQLGALPSQQYNDYRATLIEIGENLGLAFQIIDDILDTIGDSKTLGKTVGKDEAQQKQTYIGVHGLDKSREMAMSRSIAALNSAQTLPNEGKHLALLIRMMSDRRY